MMKSHFNAYMHLELNCYICKKTMKKCFWKQNYSIQLQYVKIVIDGFPLTIVLHCSLLQ